MDFIIARFLVLQIYRFHAVPDLLRAVHGDAKSSSAYRGLFRENARRCSCRCDDLRRLLLPARSAVCNLPCVPIHVLFHFLHLTCTLTWNFYTNMYLLRAEIDPSTRSTQRQSLSHCANRVVIM